MKFIFISFFLFFSSLIYADVNTPFQDGEELKYDIKYKYGLVMLKAGNVQYKTTKSSYSNKPTYKSSLVFRTNSFFDKIYKVRDTLTSHVDMNLKPLYHVRSVNEGSTHFKEELVMKRHSVSYTEAYIKRENKETVKFDTTLIADNLGYDILNIFIFARTLDYPKLHTGETFNMSTFIGKRKVNVIVKYEGQSIVEKSPTLKYKAFRLAVDITDDVFNESKNAMEMWISDDENRLPIKIKAKLKIGAAEAELSSHRNLKYPFTSEVKIVPRQ